MKPRKLFARELAVLLCLVSLMISIGQGQITSSKHILNSFGSISDPTSVAQLLFQSSFEDAVIIGTVSEPAINLGISNYISLTGTGSQVWIEDGSLQSPHTGSRCLGLRSDVSGGSVRAEVELTHLDGSRGYPNQWDGLTIQDDFYVSVWLYFPADWSLKQPGVGYSPTWYELMNLFVLNDIYVNPRTCLHIHRDSGGVYDLTLEYDTGTGGKISWVILDPFDISTKILGKWTKWAYFLHRSTDSTQAYMQMWLDEQLLGTFNDQNGSPAPDTRTYHLRTRSLPTSITNWFSAYAKTYLSGDGNYHYLYADDLEVWSGLP